MLPSLRGDLVLTSPPYVDQRTYSGGFPLSKEEWLPWLYVILELSLKAAPSALFNLGDRRRDGCREWDAADFATFAKKCGIPLWERFLWVKYPFGPNGAESQPDDPLEFVLWFGAPDFDPAAVRRPYANSTITRYSLAPSIRWEADGSRKQKAQQSAHPDGARPTTLIVFPCLPTEEYLGHPAQFPIALPTWFVSAGTRPGQIVIDPFMGSGTALRAAKDLGRRAIGIEIEEKYCEIAAKRLSQEVLEFK